MAAGLGQQALARIDQHDRQVGGRGTGGHVAGVLFVARAVGDDELALLGAEEAVRHIDGDALLAFGGQAVDQQREVDVRSEEHTSELQSLMRLSYAVFCLKKQKKRTNNKLSTT